MQSGKLIALAYNSEAFQQEPETLKELLYATETLGQRGIMKWFFPTSSIYLVREIGVKLEVTNYSCIFFWFNAAIVLSDLIFCQYSGHVFHTVVPGVQIPFAFDSENIYIAQLMLFN